MQNPKEKKLIKITCFLAVVSVVFAASGIYYAVDASRCKRREKVFNEKAVSSLCESLDAISVNLKKSIYTSGGKSLEQIGNELCRQSAAAKENLGVLSFENELCDEVYKFLSQVGNYTLALSKNNGELTQKNITQLENLRDYSVKISDGLNEICFDYYNGDVSLGDVVKNLNYVGKDLPEDFYVRVNDVTQTMTDYPTLVYDGPFSDSVSNKKSVFLENKDELTAKEALKKVSAITGVSQSALRQQEDIKSKIEAYSFTVGDSYISVTKKGGYLCSFMTDAYALEENISQKEAVKRGLQYLEQLGFESMKSSYYSTFDGICTVNYAYEQDGVTCYGDLIKVSISLDTGKLVGFDAKNYLLNHTKRSTQSPVLTQKEAEKRISSYLKITDSSLAIIPLENGKEAFCYEFHCEDKNGNEALVYVNTATGEQENILLLLYSDGGVLTK